MLRIKTIDFPDGPTPEQHGVMETPLAVRDRWAIRPAVLADAEAIAAIWNREVLQTAATTDTEPRTPEAQRGWLAGHGPRHPVIVAVEGPEVVAFGALSPYRTKPSYAATVEDSIYVKDGWRGKGLGGLVLDTLLRLAGAHGHRSVVARITAGNEASLLLHERHGFVRVGHERQVAFKHGSWLDVLTLQRLLGE
jgi:L-amino acid N-acyltransferase YncA